MADASASVRPRNRDSNLKMLSFSKLRLREHKTFEGFDPGSE